MILPPEKLYEYRFRSALLSKGISSDPLYSAVISKIKNKNGHLLEFGAGRGALLERVRSDGFCGEITAVDILPVPENLPDQFKWIQCDLNNPINLRDETFDLIISTEVIEHLENPRSVFREFNRLLRPGGEVIVTTPNNESMRSYLSLVLRGHFASFQDSCYPAHITALLRKDIIRVCSETGFEHPRFDYTNNGGIPGFPHISWQKISFNLLKGRLFSDNILAMTSKLP